MASAPVPVGERNRDRYALGARSAPAASWMLEHVQHDDGRTTQCICKRAAAGMGCVFWHHSQIWYGRRSANGIGAGVRDSSALGR